MFHPVLENDTRQKRRQFLRLAGVLALGTAWGRNLSAAAVAGVPGTSPERGVNGQNKNQISTMPIGILLGTFARPTLEARMDAARACGLDCVQVSLDCAGLAAMPDEIPAELAERIRREAAVRGLTVAAVQGTFNMSHPDAEQRQSGLRRLRVLAGACQGMGTSKIHLCTGTRDRSNMWRRHPDNNTPEAWRDMVACMREAVEIAREARVVLAFEPEVNNVVDSAKEARQLLDEIGSPHLKVTIDPANIFHAGELPRMKEILDEAFELLGRDIALAHAKDLDRDGDAGHKAAGEGKLDYDRYLTLLHKYAAKAPLLLHGLSEAQVPRCVAFLREKLRRVGAAPSDAGK